LNRLTWIIVIIGAAFATLTFGYAAFLENSAPRQAAEAGLALCLVVIPYTFARAVNELSSIETPLHDDDDDDY